MDKLIYRLSNLDKRWIYLLVFISVMLPFIPGFNSLFRQEFKVSKETQQVYDTIDQLKEGDAIYIDWAFDPTTQAELLPMVEQTIKHCFDKKIKVFIYYPVITAIALGEDLMAKIKKEEKYSHVENKVDYIHLGFLPIGVDMILFSGYSDFKGTFNKEGKIFDGIRTFADIGYIITFSGGSQADIYISLQRRFGFKIGCGVTAVLGPDYIPFLQTKQLTGMLFGLKGAAEYENLREDKGIANQGMASLTLSHLVMFLFIIIGNIIYFYEKKNKKGRG